MKVYVLHHLRSGLYFNGTCFAASFATARLFAEQPDLNAVRLIWGNDVDVETYLLPRTTAQRVIE